jgi:hypothetical protein
MLHGNTHLLCFILQIDKAEPAEEHYSVKAYGGEGLEVKPHAFSTLTPDRCDHDSTTL